jgi:Zn-dependent oligopeptidase
MPTATPREATLVCTPARLHPRSSAPPLARTPAPAPLLRDVPPSTHIRPATPLLPPVRALCGRAFAVCSEGDGNSTRLAKCPRDFVEAPSQMLENWCWQPTVLNRISKHHQTGEPLPATLREALVAAKNVMSSVGMMRQIYLATLDLKIHAEEPPTTADGLQALVDTLRPELTGIRNPPRANFLRSFGHLMNQYSAAYYGYMWAEVISADMFETKFAADCMSKEAGMAYRKQVLAPGGTGKIMEHLSKFLGGRAPKQEPFLKSRGIL